MKKLTLRYKNWLARRSRSEIRCRNLRAGIWKPIKTTSKHIVTAWLGDRDEEILALGLPSIPPKELSLQKNPEETLSFLATLRERMNLHHALDDPGRLTWLLKPGKGGKRRRIRSYIDFSKIEKISTAAALVLIAEYFRAAAIIKEVPPTFDRHRWNSEVLRVLFDIGFFEAIGLSEASGGKLNTADDVRTLKAMSGSDGDDLQTVSEALQELPKFLGAENLDRSLRVDLNTAIGEAMINVAKWAYPSYHSFQYPNLGKFWVTGAANKATGELTVVIYDQGASIPITYPRKELAKNALDHLKQLLFVNKKFAFQNDSAYVDCAVKYGKSQTDEVYRGKGMPQMKELVDQAHIGSLTICSRGGLWHYDSSGSVNRSSYPNSIGGTLIEWTLELRKGGKDV